MFLIRFLAVEMDLYHQKVVMSYYKWDAHFLLHDPKAFRLLWQSLCENTYYTIQLKEAQASVRAAK